MGNANFVAARIQIDDEDDVARAGTSLTGTVVVKVKNRICQGVLYLDLRGQEKAYLNDRNAEYYSDRDFFHAKLKLWDLQKKPVDPGTYCLPFTISLPKSLPSSFDYPPKVKTAYEGCRIEYKMIIWNAVVGTPGGKKKKINIYERVIKVKSSPLPDSRVPCMVEPSSHEIKSLGFSRGELLMGASVVDTHIGRSEMLAVNLACGNASRVNITKVEVKLCETVYWKAINEDDISKYASKDMTKTKNLMVVPNLKLPGLVRKRSMSSDELDFSGGDEYERIYKDLMSGQSRFRLQIPKKSLDSYKGQCLKVTHHLKVKLWTPTLTDNPHIIIPLQIGYPPKRELPSSCLNDNGDKRHILPDVPVIKNDENNGFDDSFVNEPQQTSEEEEEMIPVGADSIMLSRVKTTKADIFLGDNTVLDSSSSSAKPTLSTPTSSATQQQAPPPSLRVLLSEMKSSINDYEIIVEKLNSPVWHELLSTQVLPSEFGSIIKEVNVEFDQPRVAMSLVPIVNGGTFTCSYCASALSNCAKWIRPTMLTKLLPYCTDIETNHTTIRSQLNKWETIVTNRDFNDAIAKRKHG